MSGDFAAGGVGAGWGERVPPTAKVIRDGGLQTFLARDLVVGDVLVLAEGDSVGADARLVEAFELRANNMALTGESEPVRRIAAPEIEVGQPRIEEIGEESDRSRHLQDNREQVGELREEPIDKGRAFRLDQRVGAVSEQAARRLLRAQSPR